MESEPKVNVEEHTDADVSLTDLNINNNATNREMEIENSCETDLLSTKSTNNTDLKVSVSSLSSEENNNIQNDDSVQSIEVRLDTPMDNELTNTIDEIETENDDSVQSIEVRPDTPMDNELMNTIDEIETESVNIDQHKVEESFAPHSTEPELITNEDDNNNNLEEAPAPSAMDTAAGQDAEKVDPPRPKSTAKFNAGDSSDSQGCQVCGKKVYPMESLVMDSRNYHKACFKCHKCNKALSPAVVTKMNNKLFCKPHYMELFRKRGRYEDIENASGTGEADDVCADYRANPENTSSTTTDDVMSTVSAKDLAAQFQDPRPDATSQGERKNPIDIGVPAKGAVSQMTKSWGENQATVSGRNREADDLDSVAKASAVRNMRSRFEQS